MLNQFVYQQQTGNLAFIEHTSIFTYMFNILHIIYIIIYIYYIYIAHIIYITYNMYIYICVCIYIYIYIYKIHPCHFSCTVTFIMFIYFLKTVQSFRIIFSQMFLLLLGQSLV